MTQERSIRLFLVDGTPNGLLTAEIMNRMGHMLKRATGLGNQMRQSKDMEPRK